MPTRSAWQTPLEILALVGALVGLCFQLRQNFGGPMIASERERRRRREAQSIRESRMAWVWLAAMIAFGVWALGGCVFR
jgi:hypothetical protein